MNQKSWTNMVEYKLAKNRQFGIPISRQPENYDVFVENCNLDSYQFPNLS